MSSSQSFTLRLISTDNISVPARVLSAEAQGRPCEFGGRVYQHGEDFQPSCEHQCSCMDGVVGCMPLCPHHVPLPAWHCANPRLETPPGRCCEEWVCDDDNRIDEGPRNSPPDQPHTNRIDKLLHTSSYTVRAADAFQGEPHQSLSAFAYWSLIGSLSS